MPPSCPSGISSGAGGNAPGPVVNSVPGSLPTSARASSDQAEGKKGKGVRREQTWVDDGLANIVWTKDKSARVVSAIG